MIDPQEELKNYLQKLIDRFVFIKHIYDDLNKIGVWIQKPEGYNALEEGASFFNLFQRTANQTLLIEVCKFIDEDEQKSLRDFLNKCKENVKPLEPTSLLVVGGFPKKILSQVEYGIIIDEMITKLDSHTTVIQNLKARRDKALAHTDSSFFNDPAKYFKTYPLILEDIAALLNTIEEILKKQALYILQSDYEFTLNTVRGIDRVLEFMRAYNTIIKEDPEKTRYRFDDYYNMKK